MLLLPLLLMLSQALVFAQFEKGTFMGRGNVSINHVSTDRTFINPQFPNEDNQTENVWTILPGLGYFIQDNLAVGAQGGMGRGTYALSMEGYSGSRTVTRDFYAGIFIRKFMVLDEKFSFFLEGYGNRIWERPFFEGSNGKLYDTKGDGWNAGISLGFQYMLSKTIGLEVKSGLFEYNTTTTTNLMEESPIKQHSALNINLLTHFGLGLNFFF